MQLNLPSDNDLQKEDSIDKQKLLVGLVKRRYPMSQDEPSSQPEKQQDSAQGYHARMEQWLEENSDKW
jgi:hypothetical protein